MSWKKLINKVNQMDALELLKMIPDKSIDLVLTDPPYGIGASNKNFIRKGKQTGKSKCVSGLNYKESDWDKKTPEKKVFNEILRVSKEQIIFGGNYFTDKLPQSNQWLVWDKNTGNNLYADCELLWTSLKGAVRKYKYTWKGMVQEDMKNKDHRWHPTMKPVKLIGRIIDDFSEEGQTILDPFMGSGTTARAAANLNRNWIGCELDADYCEIWRERMRQQVLF